MSSTWLSATSSVSALLGGGRVGAFGGGAGAGQAGANGRRADDDDADSDGEGQGSGSDGGGTPALPPQIAELLRCFICLGILRKAAMCPSCSKMACELCLRKWLTEQRSQCPHCRSPLSPARLVQCRFIDDLNQQLPLALALANSNNLLNSPVSHLSQSSSSRSLLPLSLSSPVANLSMPLSNQQDDCCEKHPSAPLYYYCEDCALPICSDCALFDSEHRSHTFSHLSTVHARRLALLSTLLARLHHRQTLLSHARARLLRLADRLDRSRASAHSDTRRAAAEAEREVEEVYRERREEIARGVERVDDEGRRVAESVEEVERGVRGMSRREAVARAEGIVEEVDKRHSPPIPTLLHPALSTPLPIPSPLTPAYTRFVFSLPDFASHQTRGSVIYSPARVVDGCVWRLKVYPGGNGQGRGSYVSAFVEMVGGGVVGGPEAGRDASASGTGSNAQVQGQGLSSPTNPSAPENPRADRSGAQAVSEVRQRDTPDRPERHDDEDGDGWGGEFQYRIELVRSIL
ncbi:hypothetical protein M427DRAFT_411756 [Gonapodya prolifera JEL478]|uniref:RING-type domain-containing protein n=1 Tax=Gonapodya prolifera (strain JEL478) TaxID=1344416 RepID=A0A139A6B1_GONPJ|nr:hypothetical protein M427DRAFT_411756 [Gonapodya prolifera JEL478]|eukprot:KXS11985.1 hypothetical protein M427DRAFT_411756 [Gonapodya prolifera JEL478]